MTAASAGRSLAPVTTFRTGVPWISSAVYGIVLLAGLYYPLAGLGDANPLRLAGFVAGMAALFAVDAVARRLDRTPVRFLAVRLALFVAVAALDESGLSRALFVLVPFTAYLTLGRYAGLVCGGLSLALLVAGYAVWVPDWYREATYLSDLLMFGMGLVLAVAMAEVATRERRAAATIADLSAASERNRMARDIHDGLGHHLTAIAIQLEKASAFGERDPEAAEQALADARAAAQRALHDVRASVGALREPPTTLKAALAHRADDATVRITGDEPALPQTTVTALHRAAQEAVTNARRHGKATRITVSVAFTETGTRLEITDDGQGFDPAAETRGYGLLGLRERATLAGGECTVDSRPGEGTRVTVTVPASTLAAT